MKKVTLQKKLALVKTKVRDLAVSDLEQVAGGMMAAGGACTNRYTCTTTQN